MELASFLVNMQSLFRHLRNFHLGTQEFKFTFLLQVSVCCKVVLCLLSLLKTSLSAGIFTKDDLTNLGEAETQFRVGLERFRLV